MTSRFTLGFVLNVVGLTSCAAHPGGEIAGQTSTGNSGSGGLGASTASTGGAGTGAAPADSGADVFAPDDGTPTRVPCTGNFGAALSAIHGRMDGYLVSIVAPGGSQACNGDGSHIHLQVQINGAIYDVAVNTDTLYAELDAPLPDGPWKEGWHAGAALDYPTNLGLHSAAFTATSPAGLTQKVTADLATANHVSIFATGYGQTGAHDVHRRGNGEDGAIIVDPLSPKARFLVFRFSTDSF